MWHSIDVVLVFLFLTLNIFWQGFSALKNTEGTLSTILKTSNESVWSNVLICKSINILKFYLIHYIHWDKTQMLKIFPLEKMNVKRNALSFLSRAPTHHRFTFNLRFLYKLKHKVHLTKTVRGIFYFQFCLLFIIIRRKKNNFFLFSTDYPFIKVYIFVQLKAYTLWL